MTTKSVESSVAPAPIGDGVDVTAAVGQGVALFSSDVPSSLDDLLLWGTVVEPAPELVPGGWQIPIAHLVKLDPEGARLLVGLNIGRGGCDVVSRASTEVDEEPMTICDAESLRRDYLGLLDDWHREP